MKKAKAINEFQHGRQKVQAGDPVYVNDGEVNMMELRGLIEPGSAEDVDPDEYDEDAQAKRNIEIARQGVQAEADRVESARRADADAAKAAQATDTKVEAPLSNKVAAPAAPAAQRTAAPGNTGKRT